MKSLRLLTLFLAPIGVAEVFVVQDSRWLTHAALGADHKGTGDAEMHEEPQNNLMLQVHLIYHAIMLPCYHYRALACYHGPCKY